MAKTIMSLPLISLILLTSLGIISEFTQGQDAGQESWCVAKPSAINPIAAINFACSEVNCSIIRSGGACFNPDDLRNHASVAMNMYYQQKGRNYWNCKFNGIGLVTIWDPSYEGCQYEFNATTAN